MSAKPLLRIVGVEPLERVTPTPPSTPNPNAAALVVTVHSYALADWGVAHDVCDNSVAAVQMATAMNYQAIFIDKAELADRVPGTRAIRVLRAAGVKARFYLMAENPTLLDREHAKHARYGAADVIPRQPRALEKALIDDVTSGHYVPATPAAIDPHLRKSAVELLANFTGPAAKEQGRMVLQRCGPNVAFPNFVSALAEFIPDIKERASYLGSVKRTLQ